MQSSSRSMKDDGVAEVKSKEKNPTMAKRPTKKKAKDKPKRPLR